MDAFINVIKKDPFVCIKINNLLDRYNRLTCDRKNEIVYDNLIQNFIPKELINIMSMMISDLDMELKMKISILKYLDNKYFYTGKMETNNDNLIDMIHRIQVKSIEDVLNYIDCGIVDNNFNTNYRVYMNMIHRFLLDSEEINQEFLFELLKQSNLIMMKLQTHKNGELKEDYYKMRDLILQSLEENDD